MRVRRLLRRPTITNANSGQNLTTSSNAAEYVPDRGIFQPAALQLVNSSLPKEEPGGQRQEGGKSPRKGTRETRDEQRDRSLSRKMSFTQSFIRYVQRFYLR